MDTELFGMKPSAITVELHTNGYRAFGINDAYRVDEIYLSLEAGRWHWDLNGRLSPDGETIALMSDGHLYGAAKLDDAWWDAAMALSKLKPWVAFPKAAEPDTISVDREELQNLMGRLIGFAIGTPVNGDAVAQQAKKFLAAHGLGELT